MSTIPQIADAIRQAIEDHAEDLPEAFTIVRKYLPRYKLAELTSIKVTVKPAGFTIERLNRGQTSTNPVFEIGVQKKLANVDDQDELDPLMVFTELLAQMFFLKIPDAAGAKLLTVEADEPTPLDSLMHDHSVWASVLRVTYKRGD